MDKPLPDVTPLTEPFWDGARAGELRIQRCAACARYFFYPRRYCPHCGSADVHWTAISGRGSLYSYIICYHAAPGYEDATPYVIAIVELDEGPRMLANLSDVEPEPDRLPLDMRLNVTFEARGNMIIPIFRPSASST